MKKKFDFIFIGLYSIVVFFIIAAAIKATISLDEAGGIYLSPLWTRESLPYIAFISFVLNSFMYLFDKSRSNFYIVIFGFTLIFIGLSMFQIAGISMMVLGLIFQFISSQRLER